MRMTTFSFENFRYGFRIHESINEALENPAAVKRLRLKGKNWIDDEPDLESEKCAELLKQTINLREFQIGWATWTTLPIELGRLHYLRRVTVLNVPIKKFPEFLKECPNLSELTLRGTDITEIPASITSFHRMRSLDISNNPTHELPNEVRTRSCLKTLRLHSTGLKVELPIGAKT